MLIFYSIVLLVLILIFCGEKGSRAIVTTVANAFLMIVAIFLIHSGIDPIFVTFALSFAASAIVLFYQNGIDVCSKTAFYATIAVLIILIPFVFYLASHTAIQGFNPEEYEITDSNGYTRNIGISMLSLEICTIIIALLGALIDSAIAVISSVYEIKSVNSHISFGKLFSSGMVVGKSILSTSMHTIFYIFMAEYFTLIIQLSEYKDISKVINSKALAQGLSVITVTGIGCCLVVPVSLLFTLLTFKKIKPLNKGELQ